MLLLPRQSKGKVLFGVVGFLAMTLLMVTGCSTAPRPKPSVGPSTPPAPRQVLPAPESSNTASVKQRLNAMVANWTGTPHKMGGNGRKGIDCSGFTQRIYDDLFDIRLPRSTATQVRIGLPIGKHELRIADLIFFRPPHKIRHVGIYMGNRQFAHASASRGVTVSNLDNPYWQNAYWTAKRVLPEN